MKIWDDPKERILALLAITAFVTLCLVEVKFPLPSFLEGTILGVLLIAEAPKNITSGLLVGLVAAYIFYLFVDFLPRHRREAKTIDVLNALIASVLDAYDRCRIFGHETPITHVKKDVLVKPWIDKQIILLKKNESKFLSLKFAMFTAHSRLEDFRHALPLAVMLSPEKAMHWLIVIDKVRLLAESYGEQPSVQKDKLYLSDKNTDDNPLKDYKCDLNLRFLEMLEASKDWLG